MKRSLCHNCMRPQKVCLCESILVSDNKTAITILRHKSETDHPFNTGLLSKLSFQNVLLLDGETFTESHELRDRINRYKTVLLFPYNFENYGEKPIEIKTAEHIIVLDGSWNKAKKIYFKNAFLSLLNRYEIINKETCYKEIRATKKVPNSLSTIESICFCLEEIENRDFSSSLRSLHQMINYQNKFKS